MCGIIGYTGTKDCVPILLKGLEALEYRGYDSAGIAVSDSEGLKDRKAAGKLSALREYLRAEPLSGALCGIGHTRWATHGAPSEKNAHPHGTELLSLVHNGIIENDGEIGEVLAAEGYAFRSDTDTERAALLLDALYRKTGDPRQSIFELCRALRGSYAFGILFRDDPETLYAIRRDSPLLVAKTDHGALIASDLPALLPYTNRYVRLEEGVLAELRRDSVTFWQEDGACASVNEETATFRVEEAQKGGYPHFMLKEIFEEPEAVSRTLAPYVREGLPCLFEDGIFVDSLKRIHIVACGTAMHAGLLAKGWIERYARLPVNVEIASEFRYRDPLLSEGDLVLLISQSGETADTLAALRHAKAKGIPTLAMVNVIGSSVAREADHVLYTRAGPEIAVASTKAYTVQCALLFLLSLELSLRRGTRPTEEIRGLCGLLSHGVPALIRQTLSRSEEIREIAARLTEAERLFYIGRDLDWALCSEASLKLKEISYLHSEAYAAGELKHGTISLITEGIPVIAPITVSHVAEKTVNAIREVKSRGATVFSLTTEELAKTYRIPADGQILIPEAEEAILPFGAITALQLLAYHTAARKGLEVDQPRNLAKSVTVE